MTLQKILPSLALVVTTSACGLKSVGEIEETGGTDDDGTSDTDASTGGSSMSNTGNTSVGTSVSSTVSTSDTDVSASVSATVSTSDTDVSASDTDDPTDSSTDTDIGCPPGMSVCDPQPQFGEEAAQFTIDDGGFAEVNLDEVSCTITEFVDDGATLAMTLECDEGELSQHTVVVPHNPITPFNIGEGSAVRFTYRTDPIFWINQWFSIRANDGRFVIGGVLGSELLHPDLTDLFAPVEVTLAEDVCGPDCVAKPCERNQREGINVVLNDAESAQILDGNLGTVGETTQYTFVVGEATSGEVVQCDDVPEAWYAIIAYDSSEG